MHDDTPIKLKLGKGAPLVKSRLRRLPQTDNVWEAGFLQLSMRRDVPEWFGLVVSVTELFILADRFWDSPPDVNDLARLVSRAAERPYIGKPNRPRMIRIRPLPEWSELIPHLEQLNIEVVRQDELKKFDEEVSGFLRSGK